MKRNTLSTIYAALNTIDFEGKDTVLAELTAELNRGAEEKAAKAAEYDVAWGIVHQFMADNDVFLPVGEIYEQIADELPEGFTRNKVTYGLTHYWKDFVEKGTVGKTNAYRLIK